MSSRFWIGMGRHMIPLPRMVWERQVRKRAQGMRAHLGFMTEEHHLVRQFAVRELPRVGAPLSSGFIAQELV